MRRRLASKGLGLALVLVLVALGAVAARGPALVPDPTPDAVEYQLLARSLARGEGFTLPLRVRHAGLEGPQAVRHDASGNRAPLFPWFLAGLEALGVDRGDGRGDGRIERPGGDRGEGRIAVGLQVANGLVGALDAVLVAALAWVLARRRGRTQAGIALVAGLAVAWLPPLIQGSCRVLAEPLGLAFVLLAAHAEVGLARVEGELARVEGGLAVAGLVGAGRRSVRAFAWALGGGLALVLARLARPEAEAVLWLVVAGRALGVVASRVRAKPWRVSLAALLGTLAALGVDQLVARGGWGPPQSFLLRVGSYRDVMFDWGAAPPVAASAAGYAAGHVAEISDGVARNLADLGYHALRYATVIPLLAAVASVRGSRAARRVVGLGVAFALVAGGVWSTRDHARFLVIPLALVTAPAVLEGARVVRALARRWARRRARGRASEAPTTRAGEAGPTRAGTRRARRVIAGVVVGVVAAHLVGMAAHGTARAVERARAVEGESTWGGPELDAIAARLRGLGPGEAFAAVSPWGLGLASGRDGVLLPVHLGRGQVAGFLAGYPAVKVVVLRPSVPHDKETPEPVAYLEELAAIGSSESVGGAVWVRLR